MGATDEVIGGTGGIVVDVGVTNGCALPGGVVTGLRPERTVCNSPSGTLVPAMIDLAGSDVAVFAPTRVKMPCHTGSAASPPHHQISSSQRLSCSGDVAWTALAASSGTVPGMVIRSDTSVRNMAVLRR